MQSKKKKKFFFLSDVMLLCLFSAHLEQIVSYHKTLQVTAQRRTSYQWAPIHLALNLALIWFRWKRQILIFRRSKSFRKHFPLSFFSFFCCLLLLKQTRLDLNKLRYSGAFIFQDRTAVGLTAVLTNTCSTLPMGLCICTTTVHVSMQLSICCECSTGTRADLFC